LLVLSSVVSLINFCNPVPLFSLVWFLFWSCWTFKIIPVLQKGLVLLTTTFWIGSSHPIIPQNAAWNQRRTSFDSPFRRVSLISVLCILLFYALSSMASTFLPIFFLNFQFHQPVFYQGVRLLYRFLYLTTNRFCNGILSSFQLDNYFTILRVLSSLDWLIFIMPSL
jgi:hypothetical protein